MPSESFVDFAREPTRVLLAAVDAIADGDAYQAGLALDTYVGADPRSGDRQAATRVRSLAAIAPMIAAAGLVNLYPTKPGDFWCFDIDALADIQSGPADVAAMRVVTAHLNKDADLALDVREALFHDGGFDALMDLVVSTLKICVALKRRGAFSDAFGSTR